MAQFGQKEPETDEEKQDAVSQAWGSGKNTANAAFHEMRIEKHENGHTVHVTHKHPVKHERSNGHPLDHHDYKTKSHVFSHDEHGKMMHHIHSHIGGDCPGMGHCDK